MLWFEAQGCAFFNEESADVRALVITEFPDGSGQSFEIQRAETFDERDLASGMNTYCLVVNQGPTHYGGVSDWRIGEENVLVVNLEQDAASTFATSSIEVRLRPTDCETVREAMSALLIPSA